VRAVPLLVLLAGLSSPAAVRADPGDRPRHNTSYVPDDDQETNAMVLAAREAAEAGQHRLAAERLQDLLATPLASVVALRPREIYVSPGRWAQLQLLAGAEPFGPDVLAAWRELYGAEGDTALRSAILAGDVAALQDLLRRFPVAPAAPTACLALSDRALLQGDPDAAYGYLLQLLDHVPLAERATWAPGTPLKRRLGHLRSLAPRRPEGWPTIGGDAARARDGDPLADRLERRWTADLVVHSFDALSRPQEPDWSETLPFYPVCDPKRLYVNCGRFVRVVDRATGKVADSWPEGVEARPIGQFLLSTSLPGVRSATLGGELLYANLVEMRRGRISGSVLHAFERETGRVRWRFSPSTKQGRAFLRGTPALRGGRLYVYGAVRERVEGNPTRKEEAFCFCVDAATGEEIWRRFLGYGRTRAAPNFPPQSGLAPATAAGVVVVSTGLGVAASLDARDGEILWLMRYSRPREKERLRLISDNENETTVRARPSWKREPPRIFEDSVVVTAPDADEATLCWLRGHLSTHGYHVDQDGWPRERFALYEYVAGVRDGRPYFVGRPSKYQSFADYQPVFSPGPTRRYGLVPPEERGPGATRVPPDLFGRPALAGPVLLVPTERAIFRYDLRGETAELKPLAPWRFADVKTGGEPAAPFGTLVAVDGLLYVATRDNIHCYGPEPR